jgi:hypothetical protein
MLIFGVPIEFDQHGRLHAGVWDRFGQRVAPAWRVRCAGAGSREEVSPTVIGACGRSFNSYEQPTLFYAARSPKSGH